MTQVVFFIGGFLSSGALFPPSRLQTSQRSEIPSILSDCLGRMFEENLA